MSAKRIKATRMLRNDMTGEIYRTCAPWQRRFAHCVYILPADAESYERMVEQMDVVIEKAINRWLAGFGGQDDLPRAALRSIGITPPKKGRK